MVENLSLNFRVFTVKLVGVRKLRNFTVMCVNVKLLLTQWQAPWPGG